MRGFTLIETIIYAALISIIIGGVLLVVYQMVEGSRRLGALVEVAEEGRFLMGKITWALDGLDAVVEPPLNATSSSLSVNKFNFTSNPITIYASGTQALISYGGGEPNLLNGDGVFIPDLVFRHFDDEGVSAVEVFLTTEYSPGAKTSFKTTIYARK